MIEKTFQARDDDLEDAVAFAEEELSRLSCSMKTVMQITVCVEEMFVNVAHYAYGDDGGYVTIVLDYDGKMFSITLIDSGIPFNPLEKDDPDITLSADERDIGGLGIFMVKKSMDDVFYERCDGKNIFTMKKEI